MNKTIIKFHSDSGHGWIEVSLNQIQSAGLMPKDFSMYSYRNGSKFYLEEDCDAPKFLDHYKILHEVEFNDIHYNSDCFIRDLERNKISLVEKLMQTNERPELIYKRAINKLKKASL